MDHVQEPMGGHASEQQSRDESRTDRLPPEPGLPSAAEEPELDVGEPDIAPENEGDPASPGRDGRI